MGFEERLLRLAIVLLGLLLPIVVFWPGAPATAALAELMSYVGKQWAGTSRFTPFLVLLSLFLAARLLTLPLLLNHARVRLDRNLAGWRVAVLSVWDVLLLLLVMRAVHLNSVGWPAAGSLMPWPAFDLGEHLWVALGLAGYEALGGYAAVFFARQLFLPLAGMRKLADRGGFLTQSDRQQWRTAQFLPSSVARLCVALVLAFLYPRSPFFSLVLLCFALANIAGHCLAEFISLWLDWHADRLRRTAPPATAAAGTVQIAVYCTGVIYAGVPAADGAVDTHYRLVSSADPACPGPNAIVVISNGWPIPPWVGNDSNSKWVGPRRDAAKMNAPGTYTYETTFDLTGLNPATAVLTGKWATDNSGAIRLNGVTVGTASKTFDAFTPFALNTDFVAGVNTLEFVVFNLGTSPNPTGLRVEIGGTAEPARA
jgi:hypothetical protein